MKQAIYLILFVALSVFGFGQGIPESPKASLAGKEMLLKNTSAIQQLMNKIMDVVGLQPGFELKASDKVSNIEAVISRRKRYIVYNPEFIEWIQNAAKDDWAVTALLAHEIGHHLNGHTLGKNGSNPGLELEADKFAGFVLNKLGASLEQAQLVIKYIAKKQASGTHPARADRMLAIENGWNKATAGNMINNESVNAPHKTISD